jgi:hypothetical protein
LIANNNDQEEALNVVFSQFGLNDIATLQELVKVEIITGDNLWQKWQSTGLEGEGITVTGEKIIEVTNLETAKLLNIPFDAHSYEPIAIRTTVFASSGKSSANLNLPENFEFLITHESAQTDRSINSPSACLFTLKNVAQYWDNSPITQTAINLQISPNPFQHQTNITISLPQAYQSVNLSIYNTQGQLVQAILTNQQLAQGKQTYTLTSDNLTEGIYIIALQADDQSIVKKVLKIK